MLALQLLYTFKQRFDDVEYLRMLQVTNQNNQLQIKFGAAYNHSAN